MSQDPIEPDFAYLDEPTEPYAPGLLDSNKFLGALAAAALLGIMLLACWAIWYPHK